MRHASSHGRIDFQHHSSDSMIFYHIIRDTPLPRSRCPAQIGHNGLPKGTVRCAFVRCFASHLLIAAAAPAQQSPATGQGGAIGWPAHGDIPAKFTPPTDRYDYVKREVMIPMRDGVNAAPRHRHPQGRDRRADPADPHPYMPAAAPRAPTARRCSPRCRRATRGLRPPRLYPRVPGTFAANTGRRANMSSPGRWSARSTRPRSITPPTPMTRSTGW